MISKPSVDGDGIACLEKLDHHVKRLGHRVFPWFAQLRKAVRAACRLLIGMADNGPRLDDLPHLVFIALQFVVPVISKCALMPPSQRDRDDFS